MVCCLSNSSTAFRLIHDFQGPKGLPPQAKQNLVLQYLHKSGTAHNIKELEKVLPSVASINGMQVKDYLQALSDENKIHVEKIGSGNWYWAFLSEESHARRLRQTQLQAEKDKLIQLVDDLKVKIEAAKVNDDDTDTRAQLAQESQSLTEVVMGLKTELAQYKDNDPVELDLKRQASEALLIKAEMWTNNIWILQNKLSDLLNGNRDALTRIKQDVYGQEYDEDSDLRDLDVAES